MFHNSHLPCPLSALFMISVSKYVQCTSHTADLYIVQLFDKSNHKPKHKTQDTEKHIEICDKYFGCDHTTVCWGFFSFEPRWKCCHCSIFVRFIHVHTDQLLHRQTGTCKQNVHELINSSLWWPVITLCWKLE